MSLPAPPNTPILPAQFVLDFPEFGNSTLFPVSQITFWATIAAYLLNPCRWDPALINLGMELFIAHNVALEAFAMSAADAGGIPGISRGVVASEAGKSLSVGYDTALAGEEGAGNFNLTIYGTRFWNLMRMMGAGPIQVGISGPCLAANQLFLMECVAILCGNGYAIGAWAGPVEGFYEGGA